MKLYKTIYKWLLLWKKWGNGNLENSYTINTRNTTAIFLPNVLPLHWTITWDISLLHNSNCLELMMWTLNIPWKLINTEEWLRSYIHTYVHINIRKRSINILITFRRNFCTFFLSFSNSSYSVGAYSDFVLVQQGKLNSKLKLT